jgi:hypothetical protein
MGRATFWSLLSQTDLVTLIETHFFQHWMTVVLMTGKLTGPPMTDVT